MRYASFRLNNSYWKWRSDYQIFISSKKVNGEVPTGGVGAAIIADINKQVKEDIPVWENKKYASKPVLCDSDGPIAKFRKHFATFYAEDKDPESIEAANINK